MTSYLFRRENSSSQIKIKRFELKAQIYYDVMCKANTFRTIQISVRGASICTPSLVHSQQPNTLCRDVLVRLRRILTWFSCLNHSNYDIIVRNNITVFVSGTKSPLHP